MEQSASSRADERNKNVFMQKMNKSFPSITALLGCRELAAVARGEQVALL